MKQQMQDALNSVVVPRLKSRTYRLGAVVATLGVLYANAEPLRPYLGDHFDIVMYLIGAAIFYYREVTTGPVSDK